MALSLIQLTLLCAITDFIQAVLPPKCGSILKATASPQHLRPRTFAGKYFNHQDCKWLITAPQGQAIRLSISSVSIEKHPNCEFDGLKIYSHTGPSNAQRKLAPALCGEYNSTLYLDAPSNIVVRFYTDDLGTNGGFTLQYFSFDAEACKGYNDMLNVECSGELYAGHRCVCKPGHEVIDDNSLVSCQFPVEWRERSSYPISCTEIPCTTTAASLGLESYRATCLPGVGLSMGHTTSSCQLDNISPLIPTCRKVTCGPPPVVPNTQNTSFTRTEYRDTATYTCLPGYEMTNDSATVTCQSNRRWSTLPTCYSNSTSLAQQPLETPSSTGLQFLTEGASAAGAAFFILVLCVAVFCWKRKKEAKPSTPIYEYPLSNGDENEHIDLSTQGDYQEYSTISVLYSADDLNQVSSSNGHVGHSNTLDRQGHTTSGYVHNAYLAG